MIVTDATDGELARFARWLGDARVKRFVAIDDFDVYVRAARTHPDYRLLALRDGKKTVAHIAAEAIGIERALCLIVDPALHGQGIGTRALRTLIARQAELFPTTPVLVAAIHPENEASLRTFAGAGFKLCGADGDGELIMKYDRRSESK